MKQFAVFGNPIAHSKSPEIHHAFATQCGIDLTYERLLVEEGKFSSSATRFFKRGTGANVTVPFKEIALHCADSLSEVARMAGAVNTLSQQNGAIHGDNTDGIGLVRDIRDNYGVDMAGKRILILGAGGAARGVLLPIAEENPQSITIANRTEAKAQALVQQFSCCANLQSTPFEALNQPYDIIINATSASLVGRSLRLSPTVFAFEALAYDMMYGTQPTPFMQFATQSGASAVDGLGMLVEQAAQSFAIWHDVSPSTVPVIEAIRNQLLANK